MKEKLEAIKREFEEITRELSQPDVTRDVDRFRDLSKRQSKLNVIVEKYDAYLRLEKSVADNEAIVAEEADEELRQLAEAENEELIGRKEALEKELEAMLIPKDPRDEKDAIVEIRAGAGGDEAGLFAAELFRMYGYFAERMGWKVAVMNSNLNDVGGFKEVIFEISGQDVFGRMKYESGVHRVQRVPETEKQGRVQTSTATVAVLPVAEEAEIEIKNEDIRIDVFRSSGPGGQSVNTTDSAVRLTHIPTGLLKAKKAQSSTSSAPASSNSKRRSVRRKRPTRARARSAPATGARRSAPTIFRKTASPTTVSRRAGTRSTGSCRASWSPSSTR